MSSIQAYKAHKQEGTLVSKVHKQGALDLYIFPIKHPYISGCIIIIGYANQFEVANNWKKISWLLDMQWSH